MKKKILSVMIVLTLALSLCGCQEVKDEADSKEQSMFVYVERASNWDIVYHRETKVMYAVSNGSYNRGTFTLLVDENGTPMIYESED